MIQWVVQRFSDALRSLMGTIMGYLINFATKALDSMIVNQGSWHQYGETNRYLFPSQQSRSEPFQVPKSAELENLNLDPYVYQKLPSLTDSKLPITRLVELRPWAGDEEHPSYDDIICCKIIAVELDDTIQFEALSYTWGTSAADIPIVVIDDEEDDNDPKLGVIHITPDLYAALKRLRYKDEPRLLWIDQLCINQCRGEKAMLEISVDLAERAREWGGALADDAEQLVNTATDILKAAIMEKNGQVRHMSNLYKRANRTLVWLGDAEDDPNTHHYSIYRRTDDENDFRSVWMLEILGRDWFRRAWVYQEAVFSKEVYFMIGSAIQSLDAFMRLSQSWFVWEAEGHTTDIRLTRGMETLYLIEHGRGMCKNSTCPKSRLMQNNLLAVLVQALQLFEATLPHDLIYAFLGFEPEHTESRISPEYESPASEAWRHATRCIIDGSGSLDVFACAPGDATNKEGFDLPSWVPDWSNPFPYDRPICAPDFQTAFRASQDRLHVPVPSTDETLVVKGAAIAEVMWLSSPEMEISFQGVTRTEIASRFMSNYQRHKDALKTYISSCKDGTPPQLSKLSQDLDQILIRTLVADGTFGHVQPIPCSAQEVIRICLAEDLVIKNWAKPQQQQEDHSSPEFEPLVEKHIAEYKLLEQIRDWSLIAQKKRIFLSNQYELGLVPEAAQTGDLICLVDGSKVPCVLRKGSGGSVTYRLIAQCYLDGWMYGEAPPGRQVQEFEAQNYILI